MFGERVARLLLNVCKYSFDDTLRIQNQLHEISAVFSYGL